MRLLLVLLLALFTMSCTMIEPGYGGIKVVKSGSNRGVQKEVLPTGWTIPGPGVNIYQFPLYSINYSFTRDKTEGSPVNEEFSVQSSEGMECTMDLGLIMHYDKSKLPVMFEKYRKGEGDIRGVVVRNSIRDALNKIGASMTAEEIYSSKKVELITQVSKTVAAELAPNGIIIESISLIGGVRPPKNIVAALNAKVEATQKAQQRENELRTAEAQAAKDIAQAKGEAEANRLREQTASPEVIKLKELENQAAWIAKWNGVLPSTVAGSDASLIIGK